MATSSPFSFLDSLLDRIPAAFSPPAPVVREVQQRLVLLLNHVLMQEPEGMLRLTRQQGRVIRVQWRSFSIDLVATPAGLLDLADAGVTADLVLTVTETSPFGLLEKAVAGEKPEVRIAGDVQLAAELNWLVDHVRWDLEEDLSRLVGDVMAHRLAALGRASVEALRRFTQTGLTRKPAA